MNHQISFKHMTKNTEGLEQRIHEETQKIEKYFEGKTDIKWTCSKHGNFFELEVQCSAPRFKKHASARSHSFEKSCDMVMKKLEKQLQKHKEMYKNKMHRKYFEPVILDPEDAWADYDEDFFQDVG